MAALRRCLCRLQITNARYAILQSSLELPETCVPQTLINCNNANQHIHPAALTNFSRPYCTSKPLESTQYGLQIRNLPRSASKEEIMNMLGREPVDCSRHTISAVVRFSKPEMVATAADNLNGLSFEGEGLKAMVGYDWSVLYLTNICGDWQQSEVEQLCQPYGDILDTKISSVWMAIYSSPLEMETVMESLQGVHYAGDVIRVNKWRPEQEGGYYDIMMPRDVESKPYQDGTRGMDLVEDSDEPDELYRMVILEVKGHDKAVLNSFTAFVKMTAKFLNLELKNIYTPPKVISRYTLLKSPHIFKKHMVQYEMRTHYRIIELEKLTGSTAGTFLEYIQRNLPEGVAMKVTKHQLQTFPDHLLQTTDLRKS